MVLHLFKLIWNKKKQNFLLITEIFVSFLVMFAVFTLLVYYYGNYKRPHGFDFENVWAVTYNDVVKPASGDSIVDFMETVRQTIKAVNGVEDVTYTSGNIPFSFNSNNTGLEYNKKKTFANVFDVEANYASVFNMQVLEGRWFDKTDIPGKVTPIVINQQLAAFLFGNESPVGKVIGTENQQKVVGVIRDMKFNGDYEETDKGFFRKLDTGGLKWNNTMLVKVKPGATAAFEAQLFKVMNNVFKNANIEIEHMTRKRERKNSLSLVVMIILTVVGGFLIINVALGLFGVLWYNINKRRGEIGLRRAVGASGASISWQLVGEALVLATLALILGSFFAVQFPLLNVFDVPSSLYLVALALAVVFIYVLVVICALYPGRQAAKIYPAVALHED